MHETITTKLNIFFSSLIYMRWDLIRENDLIAFLTFSSFNCISLYDFPCFYCRLCYVSYSVRALGGLLPLFLSMSLFLKWNYIIGTNKSIVCSLFLTKFQAIFFLFSFICIPTFYVVYSHTSQYSDQFSRPKNYEKFPLICMHLN